MNKSKAVSEGVMDYLLGTKIWFPLYLINVMLHVIGLTSLIKLYRKRNKQYKTAGHISLMNISAMELFANILGVILMLLVIIDSDISSARGYNIFLTFTATGSFLLYAMTMFAYTAGKLVAVAFPLHYHARCDAHNAKRVVLGIWFTTFIIAVPLVIWSNAVNQDFFDNIWTNVTLTLSSLYLLFSIVSSLIIIIAKIKRRKELQKLTSSQHAKQSDQMRRSGYQVTDVLLIMSYIICIVVPILINNIMLHSNLESPQFNLYANVSWTISDTIDAIIYVFLYKPVRQLLYKVVTSSQRCSNRQVNTSNRQLQLATITASNASLQSIA